MKNDIANINQNAKVALAKSKNLLNITNTIFKKKKINTELIIKVNDGDIIQNIPRIRYQKEKLHDSSISNQQNVLIEFDDGVKAWLDQETNLMWEIKNVSNINHQYIWSNEFIEGAWFQEKLTDKIKDAFSYANELNKKQYAGFNDWRIPTEKEFKTLISKEIHNNFNIKFPLSKNTMADAYWSSDYAVIVFFVRGSSTTYVPAANFSVRCVRGKYKARRESI